MLNGYSRVNKYLSFPLDHHKIIWYLPVAQVEGVMKMKVEGTVNSNGVIWG